MFDSPIDCAIIGAGPAGLTAAIYLARFRRRIRLFDAGSRQEGFRHALFLRTYTRDLTLYIQSQGDPLSESQRKELLLIGRLDHRVANHAVLDGQWTSTGRSS